MTTDIRFALAVGAISIAPAACCRTTISPCLSLAAGKGALSAGSMYAHHSRRIMPAHIMTNASQLNLALIGCGGIAQEHWRGIQQHTQRLRVTAVVDADAARAAKMAEQTGAQSFSSIEDAMVNGNFGAVDIMLPHHEHEDAALKAFAAGKHVVLEKPMSTNVESCQRILDAAQRAGTVFMVAEQAQYWPDALLVQEVIRSGRIGDVITARAFFGNAAGDTSNWHEPWPWRFYLSKAGGGISIDGGAHWLRPLRMWLGEVEEVVAATSRPLVQMEGESLARALLRLRSGVVASFDALYAGAILGTGEEFRIIGTLGEIIIERGQHGRVLLIDRDHPHGDVIHTKGTGRLDAFGAELLDFERAVLDGTPLAASPEYSLGELRTALALYRSAETKRWEPVW
jgi:predicted dehydrogenase